MPPEGVHLSAVFRVPDSPPIPEPGEIFSSSFAREMMAESSMLAEQGTSFKSDFASLVYSDFNREEVRFRSAGMVLVMLLL